MAGAEALPGPGGAWISASRRSCRANRTSSAMFDTFINLACTSSNSSNLGCRLSASETASHGLGSHSSRCGSRPPGSLRNTNSPGRFPRHALPGSWQQFPASTCPIRGGGCPEARILISRTKATHDSISDSARLLYPTECSCQTQCLPSVGLPLSPRAETLPTRSNKCIQSFLVPTPLHAHGSLPRQPLLRCNTSEYPPGCPSFPSPRV